MPSATEPEGAPAAPGVLLGVPPPDDGSALARPLEPEIHFNTEPGWGIGLDARAGLGILTRSDARGAFAFAGGLIRAHYLHYELGGFYEHSDEAPFGGGFAHYGGFAGAWLPYKNWVDFEIALGVGRRSYADSDPRYGAGGYEAASTALSLTLGVSDRAASGRVGGRVGGQLIIADDLSQKSVPWKVTSQDEKGDNVDTTGKTHVGGLSIAIVFTIGLDYGEE